MQQNIDRICLVPSSPRSALAKQVESLYNVCEMADILNGHSQECQHILELRNLSASIDPFMEMALQTAHQKIRKCTDFLLRECIDLAKEAATWGVFSAVGRDQKKYMIYSKTLKMWERSFKSEDVFYWLPVLCWMHLGFVVRSMMICMMQIEKLEKDVFFYSKYWRQCAGPVGR